MDGKDEVECGGFIARNKEVTTNRFDSKAFKAVYDRLYKDFCKPQTVCRFTGCHSMRKGPCISTDQSEIQEPPTTGAGPGTH